MSDFSNMVQHYQLPPNVTIYLITDTNVVAEYGYAMNLKTNQLEPVHKESHKFNLTEELKNELPILRSNLLSQTAIGKKSIIAIFEDLTVRTLINVDKDYTPTLSLKNQ